MTAARQVVRFSIPGSVFLLLLIGFIVMGRLIQGDSLAAATETVDRNVAAVAAIFSAIPLGFLIYQLYYLSFRPFIWIRPYPRHRRWVRTDRGGEILGGLPPSLLERIEDLFGVKLRLERAYDRDDRPPWKWFGLLKLDPDYIDGFRKKDLHSDAAHHAAHEDAMEDYHERWYDNWDVLRTLIDMGTTFPDTLGLKNEYTTLSDVYHALGACRSASTLAWLLSSAVVLTYVCDGHGELGAATITVAATALVCLLVWIGLNQTRRQTWKSIEKSLRYGLRWILHKHSGFFEAE